MRKVLLLVIIGILYNVSLASTLKVDFGTTTSAVESGYVAYTATHEQAYTFTTQSFNAFDTTITITPSWANGASAAAMQMIKRNNIYTGPYANLLAVWIGTDAREVGNPMTLTISGLPAGSYSWLSYHHDLNDQTGLFDLTIYDASGQQTIKNADISSGIPASSDKIMKLPATITSNGIDNVRLVFSVTSLAAGLSQSFFVMNGFDLEKDQDVCFNTPPAITGPQARLAITGKPLTLGVTVTDDGRPCLEGCFPADVEPGTAYPLEFQWLKQSGPGTVTFDPATANQQAVTATFTLPGKYLLSLAVSDAPEGISGRATSRYELTVEVIDPMDGDVNFNQSVFYDDLTYLATQWLTQGLGQNYSADLDNSGLVDMADFAEISANWLNGGSGVEISEFLASNKNGLPDGDGLSSDWIEIHNRSTSSLNLEGWYLTDDTNDLHKWPFPADTILSADGYMIVFATNQPTNNYIDKAGYLHTNFSLDKTGGYLALVSPDGRVAQEFSPAYPPQESDISFGLWYNLNRYFSTATPGSENSDAFLGFTDKPKFSVERGIYDLPFSLEITSDITDAVIYYTLDGSEPSETNGTLYDPASPLQINTTSVVRAASIMPGYRPGNVKTATYIFPNAVTQQPANPTGWPTDWGYNSEVDNLDGSGNGIVPADYAMDQRVVNSTLPGYSVREALLALPSVSICMDPNEFIGDEKGLWANPSILTEYKCSMEYIPVDGSDDFQVDCKAENHGGSSRRPWRMQKHNLRLTFTSEYGPSRLEYPLFPGSPVTSFNQLVLKGYFTDTWALVSWDAGRYRPNDAQYIRDYWMKDTFKDMGQQSSYGRYVHLYVNGLYFGMFNLTELIDEAFLSEHMGGEPEDWTVNKDFAIPDIRWNNVINTDVSSVAGYQQALNYIDIENFADYMLLHFYADCEDWPHHNGVAAANAVSGDGKLRFFVWDQEISLNYHGRFTSRIDNGNGAGAIFQKMRTSEEFRLLFADRVYKHCFNNGALNVANSQTRYQNNTDMIDKAIVAESARWGDTRPSMTYGSTITSPADPANFEDLSYPTAPHGPDYYFTREDSWLIELDNVVNNYIPNILNTSNSYALINVLRSKSLYPTIDPAVLNINGAVQFGGHVNSNAALTMTNPNTAGIIYYTTDGSDPRLPGGAVSSSAYTYSSAITLTRSTVIKTRILSGTTWSALAETTFAVGPVAQNLRISELMYHPADPNTEFIELVNLGSTPINLNLVEFTKGVDFVFGDITLQPGQYTVIVEDMAAFTARYGSGLFIAGQYTGSLDNSGERIKLKDAAGLEIQDFDYKDSWHELTDGYGFSLTAVNPASTNLNDWSDKSGWQASLTEGGTPAAAAPASLAAGSVVINEILAHSHNDSSDWIELHNTTSQSINIGGWFLSDDNSSPDNIKKYEIPAGTIIPAGEYMVFIQSSSFNNSSLPTEKQFGLSEGGESVYLYSGSAGQVTGYYQTEESFDASETGVSFGRYVKPELSGGYDFTRMAQATQGYANSEPLVPDVVITEIHYNPDNGTDYEFVELYNRSGQSVTLMSEVQTETSPGMTITENLPWRIEGIDFTFPANTTIAAGQRIIIAYDPTKYSSLTSAVYGPYTGKLDNGGEQIQLQIPGDQEYGKNRFWIPLEKVDYDDTAPWPTTPDGGGKSLNRVNNNAYGRVYSNWTAANPTPGN